MKNLLKNLSFIIPSPQQVLWLTTLAAVFPILGWIGGRYWLFDLFNHFQFQYAAFFLLSFMVLLLMKSFRGAGLAALLLLIPLVRIAPSLLEPTERPSISAPIHVASFNVLASNQRYEDTINWVRATDPDCIYFSETTATWAKALTALSDAYPHAIEVGSGFAFYSKFPINRHEIIPCSDKDFPLLIAHLSTPDGEVAFFGIHPLPPVSQRWAVALDETMKTLAHEVSQESERVIVVGDFNMTRWSHMSQQLAQVGLLDACYGKSPGPTWMRKIPLLTIPIDRIFFRGSKMTCQQFSIGPDLGSDHRPVHAKIAW